MNMINKHRQKKAMKVIEDRLRGNNTIDLFNLDDETLDDAITLCKKVRSTLNSALIMYESSEDIQNEINTMKKELI